MSKHHHFEVIIIGGSYAGLSAAMSLGRSLRKVLIIDSGLPCNRQTPHSHNFVTHDGATPTDIAHQAKTQVLAYKTVSFLNGLAVAGAQIVGGYTIKIDTGEVFEAQKLIFATGIKDIMPAIRGFEECWGISMIHCPYCHGYEFRGQKTGIMANGDRAFHLASLIHNLTDQVTLLTRGAADFSPEQLDKLKHHHIQIIETEMTEVVHRDGQLREVVFQDGTKQPFDAVYAALPFVQHCDIPASLGCALTDQGYLQVDDFYKTTQDGVFACGDNATRMRSVANAVAAGNLAGAMVNMELTQQAF